MVPFRVFDPVNKQYWRIINFHPDSNAGGSYLAAKEDQSDSDGDMKIIQAKDLVAFKFKDFLEEEEGAVFGD